MTSDRKWVIVAIGFAVCFYLGWFFPVLWLMWIISIVALLIAPTKQKTPVLTEPELMAPPIPAHLSSASFDEIEKDLHKQLTAAKNDDVRQGLNQALEIIKNHRATQSIQAVVSPQSAQTIAQMPAAPAPAPSKPLDQTLVLLYIGAFLLFGGMSLFAAYSGFGNSTRLTTLAVMAAIFYGGGLYLYKAKQTLRPAGVTFVSVGLLLIPLVGIVTAYLTDAPNALVWVTTSVIALPLYLIALYATRAQVVGYMAFLMWLSLAESAVNLFDAPLHIFVWAAIVIGIVTQLLLSWVTKSPAEVREPFRWSSMVLVPAALVANVLGLTASLVEWQLGVSLILAGLYYATCAYTSRLSDKERDGYQVVSHVTAVLGALLVVHDTVTDDKSFGLILSAVGFGHLAVWFVARTKLGRSPQYEQILYMIASLAPFIACAWFYQESGWLLAGLLAALLANIALMLGKFRDLPAVMSVVIGLLLPPALANISPGFLDDNILAALSTYYFFAFVCFLTARILRNVRPPFIAAMRVGYGVALGLAWVLAMASGNYWLQIIISLLTMGSLVGLSAYEKQAGLYYFLSPLGAILFGIFLHHVAPQIDMTDVTIISVTVAAAASYGLSLIAREKRGEALLFMAIAGGVLAWLLTSFTASDDYVVLFRYFAPTILAVTSLTLAIEQKRLNGGKLFMLLPGAGLLFALCQVIYLTDSSVDFLVYTHLWSAYGAVATYLVSQRTANKDNIQALTYLTLAIFTIPVVFKALDQTSGYSLLLLFEQALLLMAGVVLNKKILTYWGAAVVVLSVVYMLRSFAYLQLLLVAVVLIGYALVRLTRAK